MAANKKSQNKPGFNAGLFLFIVVLGLAGGGAAALYFTDNLQTAIDFVSKKEAPVQPEESVAPEMVPEPVVVEKKTEPKKPEVSKPEKTVVKKPVETEEKVDKKDAYAAACRKRFKSPEIDKPFTVVLKGNAVKKGILKHLDEKGLRLDTGKIEMTVARSQLSSSGLARCYEDDYVKYMVARKQQQDKAAAYNKNQEAKLREAYAKFMASKKKGATATEPTSTDANMSADNIEDIDFKKWMEENGQSDLLKARQERVKTYEAERRKAGRSY